MRGMHKTAWLFMIAFISAMVSGCSAESRLTVLPYWFMPYGEKEKSFAPENIEFVDQEHKGAFDGMFSFDVMGVTFALPMMAYDLPEEFWIEETYHRTGKTERDTLKYNDIYICDVFVNGTGDEMVITGASMTADSSAYITFSNGFDPMKDDIGSLKEIMGDKYSTYTMYKGMSDQIMYTDGTRSCCIDYYTDEGREQSVGYIYLLCDPAILDWFEK